MLGFGKRKSHYDGFLGTGVAASITITKEIGVGSDAISIASYVAAYIYLSALNGGVKPEDGPKLIEDMRTCSREVFGHHRSVALAWSTGFHLALSIWNKPDVPDRAREYYRRRALTLPWELDEPHCHKLTTTTVAVVRASILEDWPRWR